MTVSQLIENKIKAHLKENLESNVEEALEKLKPELSKFMASLTHANQNSQLFLELTDNSDFWGSFLEGEVDNAN